MGSYYGDGLFWDWSSDKDKLCAILDGQQNMDGSAWGEAFDTIFTIYQQMVMKDTAEPFKISSTAGVNLVKAVSNVTGYSYDLVNTFMMALTTASHSGQISATAWNPKVPGHMYEGIVDDITQKAIDEFMKLGKGAAKALSPLIWPIVAIGGVVALFMFMPELKGAMSVMRKKKGGAAAM